MDRTDKHSVRKREKRAYNVAIGGLCVGAFGIVAAETLSASFDGPIDGTRAALEQWVETRRLISQEKRDWATDKEVLQARIDLVQREIASMRTKVSEGEASVVATDLKREELLQEHEALSTVTQSLGEVIVVLEARTRALLPRLPPPIRERVKVLSQRLPEDPGATKATLSERFQNVVGILNEIDKFNRDVTLTLEVRELPGGGAIEVTTLYLGLGQAYYASANGDAAGSGSATADGWAWTPANDSAAAILDAIAVHKNEAPAEFVPLPLRVD
jgi:hypothetical protein